MAKSKITGLDQFTSQFDKLVTDIAKINRGALGEAAGYVADQMKAALETLPVRDESTHPHKLYGATASEKKQIISNFGISRFRDGGTTTTSVGFTGYVNTPSKRFNGRVPTGMLMQCIEYGTDFRQGTHTLTRVMNRLKNEAAQKAQEYIEKEVNQTMN